ncbi:hypothetical protein F9K33_10850 [bacterium]|nr:MAG: hypothetical protein F9K33_10850 [bacterium]
MRPILLNSLVLLRKSKVLLVLSALPAVVAAGLMFIPLFRDFDYEFNETFGVIVFLTAMGISIAVERVQISGITGRTEEIVIEIRKSNLYIFKYTLCIICLSLITPLIIVLFFLFFCETCSLTRGLQLFLLLPVSASLVGWSVGHLLAVLFGKGVWIAAVSVIILSAILNIFWLQWHVPIYVYSVFWGYFPGPLYDEWIPVTFTLWIHRLWSLCFAVLFIVSSLIWKQWPALSRNRLIALAAILLLLFSIYGMRFKIGFDAGYDELKSELGAELKSDQISIFFDKTIDTQEMKWVQVLAEFYYQQVSHFLGLKTNRMVTIYVYIDEYQKKKLMGAGVTNFAKIINDEIHINYEDIDGVLKHEMTHVLANDFGHDVYSTTRIGFLEGLAVAAEWNENYFTPHEWAAALKQQNKLPDVLSLIGGSGFLKNASGMSYIVSGSFTRFLIDSFGVTKFKKAYYDEDVEIVYGIPKTELAGRWMRFLDGMAIRDDDIQLAGLLIRPSLFQKKCPHYVADILEAAGAAYSNEHFSDAAVLYQKALDTDKENYRIQIAHIRSDFYAGQLHSALHSLDSLLADESINYPVKAMLRLLEGDILLSMDNLDSAMIAYQQVKKNYKNIPYVYMSAILRMDFVSHGLNDPLKELAGTLNPNKQEMVLRTMLEKKPNFWAGQFWLARLCFQRSAFADVVTLIENPSTTVTDTAVAFARSVMMADSYVRLAKYEQAQMNLEEANKWSVRSMDLELIAQKTALLNWLVQRSN